MKRTIQIISIILFFSVMGYALTYPYELSYHGDDEIIIIEESYEFKSLEEVINRPEFKNKVLYIRLGTPLESEILIPDYYGDAENKVSIGRDGNKRIIHSKSKPNEYQLRTLAEMKSHYKNAELEMLFLSFSDSKSNQKNDEFRKWKAIVKKNKIKGYHLIMSTKFYKEMRDRPKPKKRKTIFPYNLIVNKQGVVVNSNAPSPSFDKERLYAELDSILKQ